MAWVWTPHATLNVPDSQGTLNHTLCSWLKHWPALRTSQWIQHYPRNALYRYRNNLFHRTHDPKGSHSHAMHTPAIVHDSCMHWHALRTTPLCRRTTYTYTSSPPTQPLTYWTGRFYQTQSLHTRYLKHHCAMACTCTAISTW